MCLGVAEQVVRLFSVLLDPFQSTFVQQLYV